ncbi:hypothetical protein [Microbacterium enclense]|uniref:hypothetical protein n=1 Tax=Microbacterium enclense TaxID=993073 RepID=UPI003F8221FA
MWSWPAITTGSITNVGAAFLIAFLLFVAERRFTRNITRTVEATAEATAGAAARQAVAEQTSDLTERVASLEDELAQQRAATQQRQDERVDALDSEITAETVWDALNEMIEVGAIRDGLVVSGSRTSPYPLVEIAIQSVQSDLAFMRNAPVEPRRTLELSVIAEPTPGEIGRSYFGCDWSSDMSFAAAVADIDAQMRRGSRMADAKMLDAVQAAAQFSRAMKLVKSDQQAPLGEEKLRGTLLELHANDWAITTDGLQNLTSDFFAPWAALDIKTGWDSRTTPLPEPAEGVPAESWSFLYSRLGQHVSQSGSGFPGL